MWADDFKRHVLECYPREAVGVLVGDTYVPCTNVSTEPLTTFKVLGLELATIAATKGEIKAILHSHPYDKFKPPKHPPEWPSTSDMERWLAGSIPWGIASTDGEGLSEVLWLNDEIAPLEGREFIHGKFDCYSLIRDYFRLQGVTLKNYPRGMDWWLRDQDLYSTQFEDAGFYEITKEEATVNDCVLMRVGTRVVSHAAVITGPNEILHHIFHRLSGKDRLNKWDRCIVRYLRKSNEA